MNPVVGSVVFDVDHAYSKVSKFEPPSSFATTVVFKVAFPVDGITYAVPPFGVIVNVGTFLSILFNFNCFVILFPNLSSASAVTVLLFVFTTALLALFIT